MILPLLWSLASLASGTAHYKSSHAPATIDVRSRVSGPVRDVGTAREAINQEHTKPIGACSLDSTIERAELSRLIIDLKLTHTGGLKRFKVKRSSGHDVVDQCVLAHLATVKIPKIAVGAPISLKIDFPPAPMKPEDPVPLWDEVASGVLKNGLRYLVMNRPGYYPTVGVVIHAGSLAERDDERGLAHFVEHMAFRGGYFGKDWVFEVAGDDGATHANGFTSFDVTSLHFLSEKDDKVDDEHLEAVKSWLSGQIPFEAAEVDVERLVVLEEHRLGADSPEADAMDGWTRIRQRDTRWALRHPIGTKESLQTFTPQAAQGFYQRWYRPDQATLMVTGSAQVKPTVEAIERIFSTLENPSVPPPAQPARIDRSGGLEYVVVAHPSKTNRVTFVGERDVRQARDHQHYGELVVERLLLRALNGRLDELSSTGDLPLRAGVDAYWRSKYRRVIDIDAYPEVFDDPAQMAEALHRELRRLELHGFSQDELDDAKSELLTEFEDVEVHSQYMDYQAQTQELLRHVRYGEVMPGNVYESEMFADMAPDVTLEQLNEMFRHSLLEGPREGGLFLDVWPEAAPKVEQVQATLDAVWKEQLKNRVKPDESDGVEPPTLAGLTVPSEPIVERWSVTETTIGGFKTPNGVAVHVVPGWFYGDDLSIRIFGPRVGFSANERTDAYVVGTLSRVADTANLTPAQRRAWSVEHDASVRVYLGPEYSEIDVRGHRDDIEALLAVARSLALDAPSAEVAAVSDLVSDRLIREYSDVEELLSNTVLKMLGRSANLPEDAVERVDIDRANQLRRHVFGDASKLQVVLAGRVPKRLQREPLLLRAFSDWGPITDAPAYEAWTAPTIGKVLLVEGMPSGKAEIRVVFHGPLGEQAARTWHQVSVLEVLLRSHLLKTMRVREGLFYTVDVDTRIDRVGEPSYSLSVDFVCDSERLAEARIALDRAIRSLPASITTETTDAALENHQRAAFRSGRWLMAALRGLAAGEAIEAAAVQGREFEELELDEAAMRSAAKRYLNKNNRVVAIAVPEGYRPPPAKKR